MENEEKNLSKDKSWLGPVLVFYAKTTSWIIFPLVLAFYFGRYVSKSTGSQVLFFLLVIAGFLITCLGIYREIKNYKKSLEKEDKK